MLITEDKIKYEDVLLNKDFRKEALEEIEGAENKARKYESFKQYEIYNDNIAPFVKRSLATQMSECSANSTPLVSCVNLAKTIVNYQATVYSREPERHFTDTSERNIEAIKSVYEDIDFDSKMQKSNKYFKLQKQCCIQLIPSMGKIQARVLLGHHYDVIPHPQNPEVALAYIVSQYQKPMTSDGKNQIIADTEDFKKKNMRYVWWSDSYNFVTNGYGDIVEDNIENACGVLPFVDIANDKDFEFFVRKGCSISDFTIQYNVMLTDAANISRISGYAQAWIKGPEDLLPKEIVVGPYRILRLLYDPNTQQQVDFGFVSPNANLDGTIKNNESILSNFISSQGLPTSLISSSLSTDKSYSSGTERFLAMIERFEEAQADFAVYKSVEQKLFNIVKAWLKVYSNSDVLDKKYWSDATIDHANFGITFKGPEAIQSDSERIANVKQMLELGLITIVDAAKIIFGENSEMYERIKLEQENKLVTGGISGQVTNQSN